MNCSRWNEKLHEHLDGALSSADARALEAHLATCSACRNQLESLRSLKAATARLPRRLVPDRDLWPEIEAQLDRSAAATEPVAFDSSPPPRSPIISSRFLVYKLAAALVFLAVVGTAWKWRASATGPGWQVATLAGAPRVNARIVDADSLLRIGQWLETDTTSRAKLAVSSIGEVEIEPNSRVRLLDTSASEHRIELARGQLSALISAPPRIFFVNTPSATAVDLGCHYTLNVDAAGNGTLHVLSGYVALEHDGRDSIIPAGQMCTTRRGAGPGTPYAADAPPALRAALDRFDFENRATALTDILAQAHADDAVTLFHLLKRTRGADRGRVFDTLARDHAPPAGVTRAGILSGDQAMFTDWSADLGLYSFARP